VSKGKNVPEEPQAKLRERIDPKEASGKELYEMDEGIRQKLIVTEPGDEG
jgi:hypothetical protein